MSQHIVTVKHDEKCNGCRTGDPADACDPACIVIEIDCPGVTSACQLWWECIPCQSASDDVLEQLSEDETVHGEEHRLLVFGWATKGEGCAVLQVEGVRIAIEDQAPDPGRYAAEVDWDEWPSVNLTPIAEDEEAQVSPA